jgi:hypothetical protein
MLKAAVAIKGLVHYVNGFLTSTENDCVVSPKKGVIGLQQLVTLNQELLAKGTPSSRQKTNNIVWRITELYMDPVTPILTQDESLHISEQINNQMSPYWIGRHVISPPFMHPKWLITEAIQKEPKRYQPMVELHSEIGRVHSVLVLLNF